MSADAGLVFLAEGPRLRVVPETEIEPGTESIIDSLAELEDLIALGETVRAEGEAIITDLEPSVLTAVEVRFDLEAPGE